MLEKLRDIKLLALDVDGVLTDGGLYFADEGEPQKKFNTQDGLGLKLLLESGVKVALISGLSSNAVYRRFEKLGVKDIYLGSNDKISALDEIIDKNKIEAHEIAYMGDDEIDIPVMKVVGVPIAVENAIPEVKKQAIFTTLRSGGKGAVREICDLIMRAKSKTITSLGVIPARYESTRFPGKPLADILGKPMVVRVYEQAKASKLNHVVVATDSKKIEKACIDNNIEVVMTSPDHQSGSDRIAEVASKRDEDIIINIQGDEPLIAPELIDSLLEELTFHPEIDIATASRIMTKPEEISDPNKVKVVTDMHGKALYFSRSPIPFYRNTDEKGKQYQQHVGIYGYQRDALLKYTSLPVSTLEKQESLEQLRALEYNMHISVIQTAHQSIGVDSPEDLERLIAKMKAENIK